MKPGPTPSPLLSFLSLSFPFLFLPFMHAISFGKKESKRKEEEMVALATLVK